MELSTIKQKKIGECQLEKEDILDKKNLTIALNNLICHLRDLTPSFQNHGMGCLVKLAAKELDIDDQDAISYFTDLLLSPFAKPIWGNITLDRVVKGGLTPAPTDPKGEVITFRNTDALDDQVRNFNNMILIGNKLIEILNQDDLFDIISDYNEAFDELSNINPTTIQDYIGNRIKCISDALPNLIQDSNSFHGTLVMSLEQQWKYSVKSIVIDIAKVLLDGIEFKGFLIGENTHATSDKVKLRQSDATEGAGKGIGGFFNELKNIPAIPSINYELITSTDNGEIYIGYMNKVESSSYLKIVQNGKEKVFLFPGSTYNYLIEQKNIIREFVESFKKD